ncbi:MAG: hypothetical protein OXF88_24240 [Rhodobacteraceae bacterium]|nr:hypothetical protein [Paracoccaceae bacterium]
MAGGEQFSGEERPAIDSRAPDVRNTRGDAEAFVQLVVVVPFIAR